MMPNKARSAQFWVLWLAAGACLAGSWLYMKSQSRLAGSVLQDNAAALDAALPGYSPERLADLKESVHESKKLVAGLSRAFYPKEMRMKKDYDSSILFVEGLSAANQELKKKADERGVPAVTLDFASKLPAGDEAIMLLTQLKSLQALVGAGMELGCRFVSVKPLGAEKNDGPETIKVIRSSLEGILPPTAAMEFLISARETEPRISIENLDMKLEPDGVRVTMTASSVLSDYARQDDVSPAAARETSSQDVLRTVAVVRSLNPFKREQAVDVPGTTAEPEPAPPAKRYFFRGKAMLRNAEVAVIEDVIARETVFLQRDESYGKLRLKSFSGDEAVLQHLEDGTVTTLKRGEGV